MTEQMITCQSAAAAQADQIIDISFNVVGAQSVAQHFSLLIITVQQTQST